MSLDSNDADLQFCTYLHVLVKLKLFTVTINMCTIQAMANQFSRNQFMALGLEIHGYKRWERCKVSTNIERFKKLYGTTPLSCEKLWQDLSVDGQLRKANPKLFLLALDFLWAYETEDRLTPRYGMASPKTCRKHIREYVLKIQSMLRKMVSYYNL